MKKIMMKIIAVSFVIVLLVTGCSKDKTTSDKKVEDNNESKIVFNAKTIDGKDVDESIFEESELTMINVWATFCGPCINEIPDLQEVYEEAKEKNVNVIGIISDTPSSKNEDSAKLILKASNATYMNIIPDSKIQDSILSNISAVPTTIFINKEGVMLDKTIVGARSKEEYLREIDKLLK